MEKCFKLTYTVKSKGVLHDVIKLSLFQFSLKEEGEFWYESLTQGSIETQDQLVEAFLLKFFHPSLTAQLRVEIFEFKQVETDTV